MELVDIIRVVLYSTSNLQECQDHTTITTACVPNNNNNIKSEIRVHTSYCVDHINTKCAAVVGK